MILKFLFFFARSIDPENRNCKFQDENDSLKLHKNYSQANCFMECRLAYAQNILFNSDDRSIICTPWFFPFVDGDYAMCDPWDTYTILLRMLDDIPEEQCSHCLPDCQRISYSYLVSTQPFRKCTEKNFMVSELCNFQGSNLKPPQIWADQVIKSFLDFSSKCLQLHHFHISSIVEIGVGSMGSKPLLLDEYHNC